MARTDFKSVDEYIATHPKDTQAVLQRVRTAIRKAVPGAEEGISYQIPTFKRDGQYVVYFAGWKSHYSLYPVRSEIVTALAGDASKYEISKGTIRFPLSEPVPVRLIARIAKLLAKAADARAQAKLTVRRKRG